MFLIKELALSSSLFLSSKTIIMKNTFRTAIGILILLGSFLVKAQNFEGSWTGAIQGMPLVFEISNNEGSYTAKMQSPKQSKAFLPMDSTIVKGNTIKLVLNAYKIKYQGELSEEKVNGTFTQGTYSEAMILEKKAYVEVKPNRPQEPKAPFPYKSEEVFFTNQWINPGGDVTSIQLAGTLTLPTDVKNPPVAILISGSGPQDRNEELFNHKPFLVIADYLTKKGIAVLRYDDRGVAKSQGTQVGANSFDFASDVEAAITYLKTRNDINRNEIGLIGHSEGGLIAPIVIANNKNDVAFFVSLAGTGLKGDRVVLPQMRKGAMLRGELEADINADMEIMKALFDKIIEADGVNIPQEALAQQLEIRLREKCKNATPVIQAKYQEPTIKALAKEFSNNWFRTFLTYDPAVNLSKVTCPVLAINGSLDYQVIAASNLDGMKSAFAKAENKDVTIKELPGLNHLFQNAVTGSAVEYGQIEETFDPATLELIASWINERFN